MSVLVAGWLLGGTVGVGTVLFAVLVGYAVSLGLAAAARVSGTRHRTAAQPVRPGTAMPDS